MSILLTLLLLLQIRPVIIPADSTSVDPWVVQSVRITADTWKRIMAATELLPVVQAERDSLLEEAVRAKRLLEIETETSKYWNQKAIDWNQKATNSRIWGIVWGAVAATGYHLAEDYIHSRSD